MLGKSTTAADIGTAVSGRLSDAGWRPRIFFPAASFSSYSQFQDALPVGIFADLRPRADAAIVKRVCGPRKSRAEGALAPQQWRATALVSI